MIVTNLARRASSRGNMRESCIKFAGYPQYGHTVFFRLVPASFGPAEIENQQLGLGHVLNRIANPLTPDP